MKKLEVKLVLALAFGVVLLGFTGCGKTNSGSGKTVGLIPNSMLLDGSTLYVVNSGDSTISVDTVTVSDKEPHVIALSQPAGSVYGSLYAISVTGGTVNSLSSGGNSSINITNKGIIALPVGSYPEYMTVTTVSGVKKGYVSLNGTNQVAVLNLDKNTVSGYITITSYTTWPSSFQAHPWGIAMVNGKVMVANNGADYAAYSYTQPAMVSVIEPSSDTLLTPVTTTTGINLQAVEPLGQTGFAVISSGNYSSIGGYAELFDKAFTEKAAVPLSGSGAGIAISTTGMGYVASGSMVGYDEINTNTGIFITTTDLSKQISGLTGFNLTSIEFAPDGTLWATDWQDNMVFEIDPTTNKIIKTFKLTEPAQDVVFVY
ncbi:MAG: hypothetical protein M1381_01665 [Deltaproteobacteria bacterium]|nr:hypothetical protein [Deltaproteobacteria bacterium]MCL5793092.1 hypothetical protein [Deltaproteobacteria bacterium]